MKVYSTSAEIISDLHSKGFTNDFELIGNDLLWVQEGVFVRAGEFSILGYYRVPSSKNDLKESVIFAIAAPYHNIKGILLNHYRSYTNSTPPVLVKKLNEMKKPVPTHHF